MPSVSACHRAPAAPTASPDSPSVVGGTKYTIALESGDQRGCSWSTSSRVIGSAAPPASSRTQICRRPSSGATKATVLPSGETAGHSSMPTKSVIAWNRTSGRWVQQGGSNRRRRGAPSAADRDSSDGGQNNSKRGKAEPRPWRRSCRDGARCHLSGILRSPPRDAPEIDDQIPHRLVAIPRVFLERLFHDHPQRQRNIRTERRRVPVDDVLQYLELAHARRTDAAR